MKEDNIEQKALKIAFIILGTAGIVTIIILTLKQ